MQGRAGGPVGPPPFGLGPDGSVERAQQQSGAHRRFAGPAPAHFSVDEVHHAEPIGHGLQGGRVAVLVGPDSQLPLWCLQQPIQQGVGRA